MEWVNPHAWLHIDVKNPKTGQVEEWMIEGGAPNNLLRHGFGRIPRQIGTEIHVEGYHAKAREVNRGNGHILTIKATGQAFFLGSSGTGAPYDNKPGTEYDANGRPHREEVSSRVLWSGKKRGGRRPVAGSVSAMRGRWHVYRCGEWNVQTILGNIDSSDRGGWPGCGNCQPRDGNDCQRQACATYNTMRNPNTNACLTDCLIAALVLGFHDYLLYSGTGGGAC